MSGISSQYTSFEKVEIQSGICTWDSDNYNWNISLKMKNTGTATATLIGVFINEIEVNSYITDEPATGEASTDMGLTLSLPSGSTIPINIFIEGPGNGGETTPPTAGLDYWQNISSGTTINIKIHSAGGMDYIKLLELV